MITEVFLLFRYFLFKREDRALPVFFRWYVVFCVVSTRLVTIVFLVKRNKEAIQNMRLKPCANGSITLYGVTPQVYLLNKTDYKGNVSLGRLPSARKWNFTAGSSHILVNWVSWIQGGFEKSYNHRERRQPGTCNRPLNKCIYFLWLLLDDYVTKRYLRKKMYDRRYFQPSKISLSRTEGGNIASRKAKTLIKIN